MEISYRERFEEERHIKRQRTRRILRVLIYLACVAVVAGIFALVVHGIINRKYNNIETIDSVERTDSNTVNYMAYDNKLLKFSRDGASALDASGSVLWNGSYDMNAPQADVRGAYAVIADIGGKEAYVYNGSDSGTEIQTTRNIVQARVANQGVTALLLEDSDSNVINIYNPYTITDNLIADIPTNISDGFPVDFALSPDGSSVVVSYVSVTSGVTECKVAFYNFSKVGQNKDHLVSGGSYKDSIVSKIEFLSDDTVCLFSDVGYEIWDNLKQPSKVSHQEFDEDIHSVFYTDEYVGFVFENSEDDAPYKVRVFEISGKEVLTRSLDFEYETVFMKGKEIVFYSSQGMMIMRVNGVVKLNYDFAEKVEAVFPARKTNHFYFLTSGRLDEIKLIRGKGRDD